MSEIRFGEIQKFVADQRMKHRANGSINRSLAVLRTMFALAVKDSRLPNIPAFPERLDEKKAVRKGFIEAKDFDGIYRAMPDHLKLPFAPGFHTGMRRGEVCGLTWANVDFLHNKIRLAGEQTKSEEPRVLELRPRIRMTLYL